MVANTLNLGKSRSWKRNYKVVVAPEVEEEDEEEPKEIK
jgi:hypothetical protein